MTKYILHRLLAQVRRAGVMSVFNQCRQKTDKTYGYELLHRLLAQTSMINQVHEPWKWVGSRDINARNIQKI